jgi:hypothetical protein
MNRCLALLVVLAVAILAPSLCRASVAVEEEEVVFKFAGVEAGRVFLAGDFNGWNPTIDLMVKGEAGFEIRLYLLPGRYRYRFVVDGVSTRDPDNPCLDAEGNSCFTLLQRDGSLEVILAETAGGAPSGSEKTRMTPSVRIDAAATDGAASLFSAWGIQGVVEERLDADLAVGLTEEFSEGNEGRGESFLLRSLASYRFERGALSAFARPSEAIDLGDTIGLIGAVGPFRYPVSLFSRGVAFEGTLPLGIEGRFIYASRLRGYCSGLEGSADSSDIFSRRDFVDSDIYGLRLGAKIKNADVRYLFREDRRPKYGAWRFPASGDDFYDGFERDEFQGFSLSIPGEGDVVLDGELLFGRSFLSATGRLFENAEGRADIEDVSREREWEHGRRFSVGVSRAGARLRTGMRLAQTTLEGDRAARGGRPDGSRTSLGGNIVFGHSSHSIALAGKVEQYSFSNTGTIFWLARTNFWLDGDELTYDLVPFLSSRGIYELTFSWSRNHEPLGGLPWGKGLRLSTIQRGDASGGGPFFREIRFTSGVGIHPRLTFLLDMRGASYRYPGITRDFVDAFLSLHAKVTKSLWCAVGTGVNPYGFDRWLYTFSDHGREDYLYGRGVFRALAAGGETAAMRALIGAEDALADDWAVTFEAGFTF